MAGKKASSTLGQRKQAERAVLLTSADKHTGESLSREKKEEILGALAQGCGYHAIAKKLGISSHTVSAILEEEVRDNPRFAEAYYRSRTPARLMHLASKALDRMDAELDSLPASVLPVVMGVALDKYAILSGQATQITEHRHIIAAADAKNALDDGVIDI